MFESRSRWVHPATLVNARRRFADEDWASVRPEVLEEPALRESKGQATPSLMGV
jgi:hypothetical protein